MKYVHFCQAEVIFAPAGDQQSLSSSPHLQNWQLSTGKLLPEEKSETRVETGGLPPRSLLSHSRVEATFWAISGDYRSIWQCSCRSWEALDAKISLSLSVCAKKRENPVGSFSSHRVASFSGTRMILSFILTKLFRLCECWLDRHVLVYGRKLCCSNKTKLHFETVETMFSSLHEGNNSGPGRWKNSRRARGSEGRQGPGNSC